MMYWYVENHLSLTNITALEMFLSFTVKFGYASENERLFTAAAVVDMTDGLWNEKIIQRAQTNSYYSKDEMVHQTTDCQEKERQAHLYLYVYIKQVVTHVYKNLSEIQTSYYSSFASQKVHYFCQ